MLWSRETADRPLVDDERLAPMTDPVEDQYTRWVYPQPAVSLRRMWQNCDPSLQQLHYAYWPDRAYWPGMRILVAGCGSNQAANLAQRNPSAQVLGIDVSPTSLQHERLLKGKYALDNLSLEQMSIDDLAGLDREFDLIVATGVLHHLPEPAAALAQLGRRLAPHGVICLMVYGRYFRAGVYMLQELFRRVGLGQSPEDVAIVRQTLSNLQQDHLVRNYMRAVEDLGHDSGIVDTFLHAADRAFTVEECLALVEQAGLRFQNWQENFYYYPNGQMPADSLLFKRLEAMPTRALWAAMELHHGGIGRHDFYCCRADRPEASFKLDFDDEEGFFDLVPVRRISRLIEPDPARGRRAAILRAPFPEVGLDDVQLRLFQCIDGQRSIARCIADSNIAGDQRQLRGFAKQFFISLWRLGYALLHF